MRALGGSGRGLVTVSLLLSALHVAAADDAHCDPSIPKRDDIPHGYRLRSDRCEGVYAQPASATFAIASFMATPAPGPLEDQTPLTVSWRAVSDAAPRLRARSIRPDLFYQMDTLRPKGTATFTWSTDVLRARGISPADLGVIGWVPLRIGNVEREVLLPVSIGRGPAGGGGARYTLVVVPRAEVREVFVALDRIDHAGQIVAPVRPRAPLRYGYYPRNRGLPIPIGDLTAPGLYYLELTLERRDGPIETRSVWFLH